MDGNEPKHFGKAAESATKLMKVPGKAPHRLGRRTRPSSCRVYAKVQVGVVPQSTCVGGTAVCPRLRAACVHKLCVRSLCAGASATAATKVQPAGQSPAPAAYVVPQLRLELLGACEQAEASE